MNKKINKNIKFIVIQFNLIRIFCFIFLFATVLDSSLNFARICDHSVYPIHSRYK